MKKLITDYSYSEGELRLNNLEITPEQLNWVANIDRGVVIFDGSERHNFVLSVDDGDTVLSIPLVPRNWEDTDKFQIYYDDLDYGVDVNFPPSLAVTQSGNWGVDVDNFPASYPSTQSGDWDVALTKFPDTFAFSAFGEPEVVEPYPLAQVDFVYGINSKLGVTETFGGGTATKAATRPHMVLSTAAAQNSWARYRTRRYLKYRSGQSLTVRFSSMFTAGVAGSIQVSGAFYIENQANVPTIIDGYGFGFNGDSFGILHANNGVLAWTPKASFNYDALDGTGPSGMNLDPTKFNLYQVKYPFLGVGTIFFYVEKPSGGMVPVHVIEYPNSATVAQLSNPNLHIQSLVYNSTSDTVVTLTEITKSGFLSGHRRLLGPMLCYERLTTGISTTEVYLFSIRCNTTINSLVNRSQLHLRRIGGANTGNNSVRIKIYRGATVTGESFTNFDANNSISAVSTAGTYTVGTGDLIHVLNLGSQNSIAEDIESFDDVLEPGEIWTITAQGGANGQAPQVSLAWIEDI